MKPALALLCAALAACAHTGTPGPALSPKRLAGQWYHGDHRGFSLDLTLSPNSTYHAVRRGCLGVYGTAKGTWSLNQHTLVLAPTEETLDMTVLDHSLDVVPDKTGLVLVPPDCRKGFKKYGSEDELWCFKRTK